MSQVSLSNHKIFLTEIITYISHITGEIISQIKVPVSKDIRLPELTEQLSEIGAEMLVDCIKTLPTSLENLQPQGSEGVTYGMYYFICFSKNFICL